MRLSITQGCFMKMTKCGKHGKRRTCFPHLPQFLGKFPNKKTFENLPHFNKAFIICFIYIIFVKEKKKMIEKIGNNKKLNLLKLEFFTYSLRSYLTKFEKLIWTLFRGIELKFFFCYYGVQITPESVSRIIGIRNYIPY